MEEEEEEEGEERDGEGEEDFLSAKKRLRLIVAVCVCGFVLSTAWAESSRTRRGNRKRALTVCETRDANTPAVLVVNIRR